MGIGITLEMEIFLVLFQESSSSLRPGGENAPAIAVQDNLLALLGCVAWSQLPLITREVTHHPVFSQKDRVVLFLGCQVIRDSH